MFSGLNSTDHTHCGCLQHTASQVGGRSIQQAWAVGTSRQGDACSTELSPRAEGRRAWGSPVSSHSPGEGRETGDDRTGANLVMGLKQMGNAGLSCQHPQSGLGVVCSGCLGSPGKCTDTCSAQLGNTLSTQADLPNSGQAVNCSSKPREFVAYAQRRETPSTPVPRRSRCVFYQCCGRPFSCSPDSLPGFQSSPQFPV